MSSGTGNIHHRSEGLLRTQLRNGVLPHAHLFIGPAGVGRADLAKRLANAIFCMENADSPCGACKACRMFASDEHPDYHEFAVPEDRQSFPIENIRQLQAEAARKPVMGNLRVFVIRDAEKMTIEASNCFLKTLEEPPGECYIILIAAGIHDLPETIASRCQITKLTGVQPEKVAEKLRTGDVDEADIPWLAQRSWGSPGRAEKFSELRLHDFNNALLDRVVNLRLEDNFKLSDFMQVSVKKLGKNAAEQRKATQEALECLAIIFRDLALLKQEPDADIFNQHHREKLLEYAGKCDLDAFLDSADKTFEALEKVGNNINRRIVLDDLFTSLGMYLTAGGI